MPVPIRQTQTPPPERLRTVQGVRAELVRLYREGRSGLHDQNSQMFGKLVHLLSVLITIDRDVLTEQRVAALEQQLGLAPARPTRPNGSPRRGLDH
jgi:hypothetical protein